MTIEEAFAEIVVAYQNCDGDVEYLGHATEHIIKKYFGGNEDE